MTDSETRELIAFARGLAREMRNDGMEVDPARLTALADACSSTLDALRVKDAEIERLQAVLVEAAQAQGARVKERDEAIKDKEAAHAALHRAEQRELEALANSDEWKARADRAETDFHNACDVSRRLDVRLDAVLEERDAARESLMVKGETLHEAWAGSIEWERRATESEAQCAALKQAIASIEAWLESDHVRGPFQIANIHGWCMRQEGSAWCTRVWEQVKAALSSDSGKALLDRLAKLEAFAHEFADEPCEYADNCPSFGTRHGTCVNCKARDALDEEKER